MLCFVRDFCLFCRYGHFSGINRKVQMKYQPKGRPRGSSSDDGKTISTGTFHFWFSVLCLCFCLVSYN